MRSSSLVSVVLLGRLALGQRERLTYHTDYDGADQADDGNTVLRDAGWDAACDPWREGNGPVTDDHYDVENLGWKCPEDMRSPSGCGDFRDDPRDDVCEAALELPECSEQRWYTGYNRLLKSTHACVHHPIYYDDLGGGMSVGDTASPVNFGRHRPRWPKFGEYEYCPPQRWLHLAEHGAIIFLYNPCIDESALCRLRRYIHDIESGRFVNDHRFRARGIDESKYPYPIENFRWLLTPYKGLKTPVALVSYTATFLSKCWNEPGMDEFIMANYRHGWEDWPGNGVYDYLWVDHKSVEKCPMPDETWTKCPREQRCEFGDGPMEAAERECCAKGSTCTSDGCVCEHMKPGYFKFKEDKPTSLQTSATTPCTCYTSCKQMYAVAAEFKHLKREEKDTFGCSCYMGQVPKIKKRKNLTLRPETKTTVGLVVQ